MRRVPDISLHHEPMASMAEADCVFYVYDATASEIFPYADTAG